MSDGLRHVTVLALNEVHSWIEFGISTARWSRVVGVVACDWRTVGDDESIFDSSSAYQLLIGIAVEPPTCPACAALLDLALEMRGSKEAA